MFYFTLFKTNHIKICRKTTNLSEKSCAIYEKPESRCLKKPSKVIFFCN